MRCLRGWSCKVSITKPCAARPQRLSLSAPRAARHRGAAQYVARRASGAGRPALIGLRERELAVVHADADAVAGHELALENLLRQRILDLLLNGALERAGAIHRIEARLTQQVARGVIEREVHAALS